MLAYAADRRRIAAPRSAPHAMLGITVAHIALIAVVMSTKMDLPIRIIPKPTVVETIPLPKPPPQQPRQPAESKSQPSQIDHVPIIVPMQQSDQPRVDPGPLPPLDAGIVTKPGPDPQTIAPPVKIGPRFITPAGLVRPPYPPSKISSEEEAVLKLRLSIDAVGRVVSVEPVAQTDRAFLEAARRHIIARWRYKPASEDGLAMASSTVITLRFELD